MTQDPAGEGHNPASDARAARAASGRRRGAGIYGAIITASIMTAAGSSLTTSSLTVSVLVTLVVYWLAEQYAEALGGESTAGRLPTWTHIREGLSSSWPIVSASFLPLAALVIARLFGASAAVAANVGVAAALVLLTLHGWNAGRAAELGGWRLAAATSIAAGLGIAMVALKNVALHLH